MNSQIHVSMTFDVNANPSVVAQIKDVLANAAQQGISDAYSQGKLAVINGQPCDVKLASAHNSINPIGTRNAIIEQLKGAIAVGCDPDVILYRGPAGELCYIVAGEDVMIFEGEIDHRPVRHWEDAQANQIVAVQVADKHFGTDTSATREVWMNENPALQDAVKGFIGTERVITDAGSLIQSGHWDIMIDLTTGTEFQIGKLGIPY